MDILFRPAARTPEDATRILEWRNDPMTLAMFYHQQPKVFPHFWEEYLRDYFRYPDLPPLFAMVEGREVAFVRSSPYAQSPVPGRCVDIDINVAPRCRRQGLGAAVIKAMTNRLLTTFDGVVAEVKTVNQASLKAFQRAGFRLHDTMDHLVEDTGEIVPIIRLVAVPELRHVFFDFDGVVADSVPAMFAVYAAFLTEQGVRPTQAEFDSLNGPSLPEIVARLKATHRLRPDADTLLARYTALRLAAYAGQVQPFPDAPRVLERLRAAGQPLFLVTASERGPVTAFLERWGLGACFQAVICGEDVLRGKPAPDIYRLALDRSGAAPQTALAVEDSPNGVRAAVAAGLRVLGVTPDPGLREALTAAGAWTTSPDLGHALETLETVLC